jgi:hypothetical protein
VLRRRRAAVAAAAAGGAAGAAGGAGGGFLGLARRSDSFVDLSVCAFARADAQSIRRTPACAGVIFVRP